MGRSVSALEQEIRLLGAADKMELLRFLLEELDGPTDAGVDVAWTAEINRRSKEIDDAVVQCTPADSVFRKVSKLIAK